MQRMIYGTLVVAVVALVATGCGERMLEVDYVEGVVTLDGEPVPGASLVFQPVTEGAGMSAYGMTDEQGRYRVTAVGTSETKAPTLGGTLAGEYHVGVSLMIVDYGMTDEEMEALHEAGKQLPIGTEKEIVPARYNRPSMSGIRATVEPGRNTIDIELTTN